MTAIHGIGPDHDLTEQECAATHPCFTITCDHCGSKRVIVHSTLGFSSQSGAWGEVALECQECRMDCTLVEP